MCSAIENQGFSFNCCHRPGEVPLWPLQQSSTHNACLSSQQYLEVVASADKNVCGGGGSHGRSVVGLEAVDKGPRYRQHQWLALPVCSFAATAVYVAEGAVLFCQAGCTHSASHGSLGGGGGRGKFRSVKHHPEEMATSPTASSWRGHLQVCRREQERNHVWWGCTGCQTLC